MFNLFRKNKQETATLTVFETQAKEANKLTITGITNEDKETLFNMDYNKEMTNNEYVAMTANLILYLCIQNIIRYNLNPEAYVELIKRDVLDTLANGTYKGEEL